MLWQSILERLRTIKMSKEDAFQALLALRMYSLVGIFFFKRLSTDELLSIMLFCHNDVFLKAILLRD